MEVDPFEKDICVYAKASSELEEGFKQSRFLSDALVKPAIISDQKIKHSAPTRVRLPPAARIVKNVCKTSEVRLCAQKSAEKKELQTKRIGASRAPPGSNSKLPIQFEGNKTTGSLVAMKFGK